LKLRKPNNALAKYKTIFISESFHLSRFSIKSFLQLNTLALEQRIKTELELNPILEELQDEEMELEQLEEDNSPEEQSDEKETETEEIETNADDEFEVEDYMNESDLDEAKLNRSS
jgi:RNA polymerase sigma-54 factor